MKRRNLILSGVGLSALGVAAALRPGEHGAPHAEYFQLLAKALKAAGHTTPTLLIDRQRLLANAGTINHNLTQSQAKNPSRRLPIRVVAKSLPCLPLLDIALQTLNTQRLMVFNLPQLIELANERPHTDLLLGKPLPVAACAQFYQQLQPHGFAAEKQLQWLIDTRERLLQYRDLARGIKQSLRINLEIDVGLHRGGIADSAGLKEVMDILASEPLLQWSGMMGYDAHVTKLPNLPGMREGALAHAKEVYRTLFEAARQHPAGKGLDASLLTLNTGGSPTYRLHDGSGTANEVSLGSALLKGSDFDSELLQDLAPAMFIASPVLKAQPHFQMPYGVEALGSAARAWDINQQRAYFIYGGNWLADPVSPTGLSASGLYGTSSNQQVVLGSGAQGLQPDDLIFFRPRQSEAVLLQFGPLAVYEGGKITEHWQPMAALP